MNIVISLAESRDGYNLHKSYSENPNSCLLTDVNSRIIGNDKEKNSLSMPFSVILCCQERHFICAFPIL